MFFWISRSELPGDRSGYAVLGVRASQTASRRGAPGSLPDVVCGAVKERWRNNFLVSRDAQRSVPLRVAANQEVIAPPFLNSAADNVWQASWCAPPGGGLGSSHSQDGIA